MLKAESTGALDGMFTAAVDECYQLMAKDNFARFRGTDSFAALLADMENYDSLSLTIPGGLSQKHSISTDWLTFKQEGSGQFRQEIANNAHV